jgi:hypothetical protein
MTRSGIPYFLYLLLALSAGCEKDEPELLRGDIDGRVSVYDENHYPLEDRSGVRVRLTDGSFVDESSTDPAGRFQFHEISYGNYRVDLVLDGYVKSYRDYTLHHLGGYSPTMVEYGLHEIPKFDTWIDSVRFNGKYERSHIYVNLKGLSGVPSIGFDFWCYFSDSPGVSKDLYTAESPGWMYTMIDGEKLTDIFFEMYDPDFDPLETDTIYLCVYPRAWGRGIFYEDHYPEALGKASNVFSFTIQ